MRRWKGEWHKRTERLTPGYLYVETSDVEKLALQLRRVPAFAKLLGNNEVFIPLNNDEVAWLNAFTGNDRRVIEMSEGIMEGSKVIVLRGPLMGHEAEIKRVDRHRRTAELEIRMLGRVKTIRLGLEKKGFIWICNWAKQHIAISVWKDASRSMDESRLPIALNRLSITSNLKTIVRFSRPTTTLRVSKRITAG